MHFTFGIRLAPEYQIVGMDRTNHGEWWHGPAGHHQPSNGIRNDDTVHPQIPSATVEMGAVPPSTEAQNKAK